MPAHLIAGTRKRRTDIVRRRDELRIMEDIAFTDRACEPLHVCAKVLLEPTLVFRERWQRPSKAVIRHADHTGPFLYSSVDRRSVRCHPCRTTHRTLWQSPQSPL